MYDFEALKRLHPGARTDRSPDAQCNPTLQEFLRHGSMIELCTGVLDGVVQEPYATLALQLMPVNAMCAAAFAKAVARVEERMQEQADTLLQIQRNTQR